MKNQWFLLSLLATFLSFISCSKDDPFPTDEEDDMSFVHSVTVGDNAYVSLFKDLNVEQTSTQNSLVFAKESFLFTYGGNIYVLESMNSRLYKYRVENGLLIQEKETMILPSGSLPAFLTFDSEEKAYWLGFIYADGNIASLNYKKIRYNFELSLSSKDLEHLKNLIFLYHLIKM